MRLRTAAPRKLRRSISSHELTHALAPAARKASSSPSHTATSTPAQSTGLGAHGSQETELGSNRVQPPVASSPWSRQNNAHSPSCAARTRRSRNSPSVGRIPNDGAIPPRQQHNPCSSQHRSHHGSQRRRADAWPNLPRRFEWGPPLYTRPAVATQARVTASGVSASQPTKRHGGRRAARGATAPCCDTAQRACESQTTTPVDAATFAPDAATASHCTPRDDPEASLISAMATAPQRRLR